MSTEVTILVHHKKPECGNSRQTANRITAYNRITRMWDSELDIWVKDRWGITYTAWYDPNVGYVPKENKYHAAPSAIWDGLFQVYNEDGLPCSVATKTIEAAQRIAELYDELSNSIHN